MRFFPHCIQKQAVNIDHFCSGWAQEQKSQMRDEKINQGVNVMPLASIISSYKHTLGCMHACLAGISHSTVPHLLHDERKTHKRTYSGKYSRISNSAYHTLQPQMPNVSDPKCQLFAPNYLNFSPLFSSFVETSKMDILRFEQLY